MFVILARRDEPATNNISERDLRPSAIFRKVTNGFRCEWGVETYAAFRSVVISAKANRVSVYDSIRFVLLAERPVVNLAAVGCAIMKKAVINLIKDAGASTQV